MEIQVGEDCLSLLYQSTKDKKMKRIKLGNKDLYTLVDDNDYEWLKEYKWCCQNGYAYSAKLGKMHDAIMNTPNGYLIDHENLNKLDNQKSNLRIATKSENRGNKKYKNTNPTGYTGVAQRPSGKFAARVGYELLGTFDTAEQAAKAYNKAAKKKWGIFAVLNKITGI